MEELINSGAYKRLHDWLFTFGDAVPDEDIQAAKKVWISTGKDNSDPVLAELNYLNYFAAPPILSNLKTS